MVQLCHWNDFGSLWLCSHFCVRFLALIFALQLVTLQVRGSQIHPVQGGYSSTGYTEAVEQPFLAEKRTAWWMPEGIAQRCADRQYTNRGTGIGAQEQDAPAPIHENTIPKRRIGDPELRLSEGELHCMGEFVEKVSHALWTARQKNDKTLLQNLGFAGISEASKVFTALGRRGRMPWGQTHFRQKLPYILSETFVLLPPAHMLLLGLVKDLISFAVGKFDGWKTRQMGRECPLMFSHETMDKFKV
jgi:hypothetical protein